MIDIEALREDFHITSIDGCCHCGDCECDGVGCIAQLDPDDEHDHPAIERLHELLRAGQAWQAMHEMMSATASLGTAYLVASDALINASNEMVNDQVRAWFRHALTNPDDRALIDVVWPEERRCRRCGCTDNAACQPFGCSWIEADLCSACVDADAQKFGR